MIRYFYTFCTGFIVNYFLFQGAILHINAMAAGAYALMLFLPRDKSAFYVGVWVALY